jgi:hypothetical protein
MHEIIIYQNKVGESGKLIVSKFHSEPIKSIDDARHILIREFESLNPGVTIHQPNGSIKNVDGFTIYRKNDRRIGTDDVWLSFDIIERNDEPKPIDTITTDQLVIDSFVYATKNLIKWMPTFKDRLSKSEFEMFKDMMSDFYDAMNLNDRTRMK